MLFIIIEYKLLIECPCIHICKRNLPNRMTVEIKNK